MTALNGTTQSPTAPAVDDDRRAAVVDLRNVCKGFTVDGRHVSVIEDLSMQVNEGETVSVVGPSGCGKTTVLRMIQGLEPYASGQILVRNQAPGSFGVDAGFVFQQPSLMPWYTVRRNIEFGLRLAARRRRYSPAERRARVDDLLELVGLAGFADYHPHQLSGGMQQRVNLARALAIDPAVLLLDEPFSAVDTLTRERLQLVLQRTLAELGTTAIVVTHDIREAVFLSTRTIVLGTRPARVVAQIPVPVGRPRSEEFQHGTALTAIAQTVYDALHGAQGADGNS